jgi:hypothetical protein
MIKKRYIFIPLAVLSLGALIIVVLSYVWFSSSDDEELVFAATEIGTPVGDKVTRDIGPEGGTLSSPDGRLTLTVPQGAVNEKVAFSIQPGTNKFGNGLGLAYKLEPEGRTFTTRLNISIHYDDHDLEGTFPEALSLAYQDAKGSWHMRKYVDLDKDQKTLTVSTTHFSWYIEGFVLKLSPSKATVRVGESVGLSLTTCPESFFESLFFKCEDGGSVWGPEWRLFGEGNLTAKSPKMIYTAPGKKPTPNVATVAVLYPQFMIRVERPCTYSDIVRSLRGKNSDKPVSEYPTKCYNLVPGPHSATSVITIVDRGYEASGSAGTTVVSGDICDLDTKFSLKTNNPFVPTFEFTPSGPSSPNSGTFNFTTGNGLSGSCTSCKYTVIGTDTLKTGIEVTGGSTGMLLGVTKSGGGSMQIKLVPLERECRQ